MNAILIDTYRFISNLKLHGFTEEQAQGVSQAMQEIDLSSLVTKADFNSGLNDLELRMTLRLGSLIVAAVGFLTAIKFFA